MVGKLVVSVLIFCAIYCVVPVQSQYLVKVLCAGKPLFRGRVDPLVEPGIVGNHVHRVFGASNFGPETVNANINTVYEHIRESNCSTCNLPKVDNSVYWHPEMFYKWPNGSLSLIPKGGLTVYYEARTGDGSQANPAWKAFPPGFRMTSGSPVRRFFNESIVAHRAISFACLAEKPSAETHGFPDPSQYCLNGLRLQVYFPSCWDGVHLDSPDHQSHVAYPDRPDGGNCPPGFPVRLLGVFFEAFYSITDFPKQNYQPYVLANGDPTGYGFHGDFLNGWDQDILQKAILDPSCDAKSTNNGNDVKACKTLAPFLKNSDNGECVLKNPIPLTEDLGLAYSIAKLPGCQPIIGEQIKPVTPCSAPPSQSYTGGLNKRFILRSKTTNKFVSAPDVDHLPLVANKIGANPTLNEIFQPLPWASGSLTGVTLTSESGYGIVYCSAHGTNGAVVCDRPSPSTSADSWEAFQILTQSGGYVAIKAYSNGKYLTVQPDGTVAPTSTTIGDAQLFQQLSPDGGHL